MEENTPRDSHSNEPRTRSDGSDDYIPPHWCDSTAFAEETLRTSLQRERTIFREFREKYIANTRTGRFLIDLYYRFENKLLERGRSVHLTDDDRSFLRDKLDRFRELGLEIAADPHSSSAQLTHEYIEIARSCYDRATPLLSEDERAVADELLLMAEDRIGSTPASALQLLDDAEIYNKAVELSRSIKFLR